MNAYESGTRKLVPAVLVYARRLTEGASGRREFLMIQRNARPDDYHLGKWNGLGGKLEPDESPLEAAIRELREESGLEPPASAFRPLGILQFPNFKAHRSEDWVAYVYAADIPRGMMLTPGGAGEGELHWVDEAQVPELPLWAGDRYFISHVIGGEPFLGTIWYRGDEVLRHQITLLKRDIRS